MIRRLKFLPFLFLILQTACREEDAQPPALALVSVRIGAVSLLANQTPGPAQTNQPVELIFSSPVEEASIKTSAFLREAQQNVPVTFSFSNGNKTVLMFPVDDLLENTDYSIVITDGVKGMEGERFPGSAFAFRTTVGTLKVQQWTLGGVIPDQDPIVDVPLNLDLKVKFSKPLNRPAFDAAFVSLSGPGASPPTVVLSGDGSELTITSATELLDFAHYTLTISDQVTGEQEEVFTGFEIDFYTGKSAEPDFPEISDEQLLTLVQEQTFKYFYDFAHPASGMARERNTSGSIVTTGGSGFGIMALIVAIERNFIGRQEGLDHFRKMLTFLETAERFHGAWPHWMNGNNGTVIPFSSNDNGGDLVETSFLVQGLITFRQYLDGSNPAEKELIDRINALWHTVEWDWYTRDGEDVLYWHWSPDKQWTMNHRIEGYNEALITYFLAAASPTYAIESSVYHKGWAAGGAIVNNNSYYGIDLPLGYDYGGPLFFAHYSFLGLDPRGLTDSYANYWTQNVNHSLINHAYSVDNPKEYVGYSDENWGLTASDNQNGYSAHSPTNDLGVITPTAALSSFPYTPEESMRALEFFYYTLGDRLWGEYGFYDAFNITEGWTANSYLAIDQGPIVVMIENYRTGLLWELFMSAPEVDVAMNKLEFTR